MNIEAAFLAAIQEASEDRTPRLLYADWLEESGDPRGELIGIEEEMRLLPVFSGRYWQLKPRRNELTYSILCRERELFTHSKVETLLFILQTKVRFILGVKAS